MEKRSRGRPKGSSSTKDQDTQYLRLAAHLLVRANEKSPSSAFHRLTGGDEAAVRRLQRRWKEEGDAFIEEARRPWLFERWERDARELEHAAPEQFARIKAFAESEGGQDLLLGLSPNRQPIPFMGFGLFHLWQLVEAHSPLGEAAAERAFAASCQDWQRFGCDPDTAFLKRFAELCLENAAALSAGDAEPQAVHRHTGDQP